MTKDVRLQPIPLWREGNLSDSDPDLERLNSAFVRFAERVRPAVVHIRAVPSSTAVPNNARGSGFIINPQGYIVTAHHVVAGAKEIEIRLADGQRFRGQTVGADPQVDFAIVKFDAEREFPALSLGDSDTLRVGEMVGSLGYPFGTESSLHLGIISRRGKRSCSYRNSNFLFRSMGELLGLSQRVVRRQLKMQRSDGNTSVRQVLLALGDRIFAIVENRSCERGASLSFS